jgi:outer membrane protein assembly factor BamA
MQQKNKLSMQFSVSFIFLRKSGWTIAVIFLLAGCSGAKFLKDNETFYNGAEIQMDTEGKRIRGKERAKKDLETFLTPKPNGTILGSRPGVWFYFIAGTPKKEKGFRSFVRNKLGRPPVLLKDATPDQTAQTLQAQLNNEGYFKSTVTHEIKTKRKRSTVIYHVTLKRPYRLKNINYHLFDTSSSIAKTIKEETLLRERQRYRVARLQGEQARIEEVVENMGLYYFDDRYLLFDADSTVGKRKVDLDLNFEPGMPPRATRVYTLKNINIYPNFTLDNDSLATTGDTTFVDGFRYIDNIGNFRPKVITDVINLKPDSTYKRIDQEYTLSHLMGLKTFKFVNVKFRETHRDSSTLDAYIYLTPLLKKSLRMEVQGVSKSNNFVGPGLEVTFTNRNLLRGAEMFQLKFNTAYEVQISRQQSGALNSFELGVEASLSVPRFLTPIRIRSDFTKYLPQTQFKSAYNFQERIQYFRLTSFNVGYGYIWRETVLKTHELFPIDVSYLNSGNRSALFEDKLKENPTLANAFQNQFIIGSRYSFILNTQLSEDKEEKFRLKDIKKYNFYLNATVDLSGNFVQSLQKAFNKRNQGADGTFQFLGQPYSQYAKGDVDFRYYLQFDRHRKLATRVIMGVGYAYGNSKTLPYIKQFSIGGSNSLRAFPARSVGPGTYSVRDDTTFREGTYFIDQRGDIKLEGNIEYRFDIIKALKGGLFFDAGNIWLHKEDSIRVGGEFHKDKFFNQIAIGTGVGLRYDFSFFVLRFDVAWPIRKSIPNGHNNNEFGWVIKDIDPRSRIWRRDNLMLNIAIGYPF